VTKVHVSDIATGPKGRKLTKEAAIPGEKTEFAKPVQ